MAHFGQEVGAFDSVAEFPGRGSEGGGAGLGEPARSERAAISGWDANAVRSVGFDKAAQGCDSIPNRAHMNTYRNKYAIQT